MSVSGYLGCGLLMVFILPLPLVGNDAIKPLFRQPLVVDVSGLKWEESPYEHQVPPEIRVYEIVNGSVGNNQVRIMLQPTLAEAEGTQENSEVL